MMRSLRAEVDAGNIKPYCFVEINGLKLASPENIYRVKFTNSSVFGFVRLYSSYSSESDIFSGHI